jgi:hypothetical protein
MGMKTTIVTSNGHRETGGTKPARLRMTRQLAEKRAVGDVKATKFDGTAFLRTLKK